MCRNRTHKLLGFVGFVLWLALSPAAWAGVSVLGTPTSNSSAAGSSLILTTPTGITCTSSSPCVLYAQVAFFDGATLTLPTGGANCTGSWAISGGRSDDAAPSGIQSDIMFLRCTGAPNATYTFSCSATCYPAGGMIALGGVATLGDPVDVSSGNVYNTTINTVSVIATSVTPTQLGDFLMVFYTDNSQAGLDTLTFPSGLTSAWNVAASFGNSQGSAMGYKYPPSTAATGDQTATLSGVTKIWVGQQVAIKAAPPAITLTSLTANSPNSIIAATTSTNASSMSTQCGTATGGPYTITTFWMPVTGSPMNLRAGQLEPATKYFCVINASSTTTGNGGGPSTTSGELNTTTPADIPHFVAKVSMQSGPDSSTNYGTAGNANGMDSYNFDGSLNGSNNYDDGDSGLVAAITLSGIKVTSGLMAWNDGVGPNGATLPGDSDVGLSNFTSNGNSIIDTTTVKNTEANFLGAAKGWKGFAPHCEASTNCFFSIFMQADAGNFSASDASILRSIDTGATTFNPSHLSSQSVAAGDGPYTAGSAADMFPGHTNMDRMEGWVHSAADALGGVTNPIDGLDAYQYAIFRGPEPATGSLVNMPDHLCRIARDLAPGFTGVTQSGWQDATKWECYTGAVGGDVNLPGNWSTTVANAATIFTEAASPGNFQTGFLPAYFPALGSYVAPASNNTGQQTFYGAPHLSGPWTAAFTSATPAAFSGSPWNLAGGSPVAFFSFVQGTYNSLTGIVTGTGNGQFTARNTVTESINTYSTLSERIFVGPAMPKTALCLGACSAVGLGVRPKGAKSLGF